MQKLNKEMAVPEFMNLKSLRFIPKSENHFLKNFGFKFEDQSAIYLNASGE